MAGDGRSASRGGLPPAPLLPDVTEQETIREMPAISPNAILDYSRMEPHQDPEQARPPIKTKNERGDDNMTLLDLRFEESGSRTGLPEQQRPLVLPDGAVVARVVVGDPIAAASPRPGAASDGMLSLMYDPHTPRRGSVPPRSSSAVPRNHSLTPRHSAAPPRRRAKVDRWWLLALVLLVCALGVLIAALLRLR